MKFIPICHEGIDTAITTEGLRAVVLGNTTELGIKEGPEMAVVAFIYEEKVAEALSQINVFNISFGDTLGLIFPSLNKAKIFYRETLAVVNQ